LFPYFLLQVFAIELVTFPVNFVPLAVEFVALALQFVALAIELDAFAMGLGAFALKFVMAIMTPRTNYLSRSESFLLERRHGKVEALLEKLSF